MRGPDVEDAAAVALGQDLGAPGVHQQVGVPGGQEAGRGRRALLGQGRAGQVEQLPALLVAEPAGPDPLQHRAQRGQGQAGPAAQVAEGRRAEPGQVAADQVLEGVGLGDPPGPEPVGGQPVEVGPAALPGARRRDPDHVHPEPDAVPYRLGEPGGGEQPGQLGLAGRAGGEPFADQGGGGLDVDALQLAPRRPGPPVAAGAPDGLGERRVVGGRDDVDGDPQQGRLHRPPLLQRPGELLAAEVAQPRPEADIGRGGVLGLEPGDLLERGRDGEGRALEEQLAGEQGPVELAGREHTLGHGRGVYPAPLDLAEGVDPQLDGQAEPEQGDPDPQPVPGQPPDQAGAEGAADQEPGGQRRRRRPADGAEQGEPDRGDHVGQPEGDVAGGHQPGQRLGHRHGEQGQQHHPGRRPEVAAVHADGEHPAEQGRAALVDQAPGEPGDGRLEQQDQAGPADQQRHQQLEDVRRGRQQQRRPGPAAHRRDHGQTAQPARLPGQLLARDGHRPDRVQHQRHGVGDVRGQRGQPHRQQRRIRHQRRQAGDRAGDPGEDPGDQEKDHVRAVHRRDSTARASESGLQHPGAYRIRSSGRVVQAADAGAGGCR